MVLNQLETRGGERTPLTISVSDPHGDFVLPTTTILSFEGLEVLVIKEVPSC